MLSSVHISKNIIKEEKEMRLKQKSIKEVKSPRPAKQPDVQKSPQPQLSSSTKSKPKLMRERDFDKRDNNYYEHNDYNDDYVDSDLKLALQLSEIESKKDHEVCFLYIYLIFILV